LTEPTRRSLVVDTSAAVAVILGEACGEELAAQLEEALVRLMSAAIRVELGIVIEARLWPAGQDVVDRFLRDAKIDIVPVDADLADRAMSAWRRYGKGRHRAALNFGDCFTYALAERTGHPVLCTGNDFAATDVAVAGPDHARDAAPPKPN
jgi:ribonuclease VapC